MEPRNIVAIEIASSKIKGAVAAVGDDGTLTILAVDEMPATDNVRYGRVQNIRAVSVAVNEILRRLEAAPAVAPAKIRAVILSLGGRSMVGMPAKASLKFPKEDEITEKHVQRLAFEAAHDFVGDKNIEATVPRMFYVNNSAVRQPVGIFGEIFKGEFVMICCGRESRQNLDRLKIDNVDTRDIHYVIRPTAVADLLLTADDKALGTALLDIGAETTTVSVYKDGSLAFLCTIPMGSRLITLDLTSGLNVTAEAAEGMKAQYAENPDGADQIIGAYARARAGEIVANVVNQLNLAGFPPSSLQRVVLTGGGAKLGDFAESVKSQTKLPVINASMPADIRFRVAGRNNADNIDVVALLATGARRFDNDFLELPMEEAPDFDDEPAEEPVKAEEPVEIVDNGRQINIRDVRRGRVETDYDDNDILADDPDDDDESMPVSKTHKKGLFGRKKYASRPEQEKEPDYDELEEGYDDDENYDDDKYDDDKHSGKSNSGGDNGLSGIGRTIEGLKRGVLRMFSPYEYDKDDEDDEDDDYNKK